MHTLKFREARVTDEMTVIHLVFGPQGAGKSTHAKYLAEQLGGVSFSIDPWMLELFGPDLSLPLDLAWIMQRVRRCEQQIWKTTVAVTTQGLPVVLDLGCMKRADRARIESLANQASLTLQLHFVNAESSIRRQRVLARNIERGDTFAFEVTPTMFALMETQFEAPDDLELARANVLIT
jgi:predicted kinase